MAKTRRKTVHRVAIMDRCSRTVLAWRVSNTMDAGFYVAALERALARFGTPEIFNTDQRSQFTSGESSWPRLRCRTSRRNDESGTCNRSSCHRR
jgi:transposase InsO family protein